jgi:enoyl-CoA hydratase/carnithine racemase
MPFVAERQGGVLQLTLDTPGAPVNIFNLATARQTVELMSGVRPGDTSAVVFRTAKLGSFINGVGLLMAQVTQTFEAAAAATEPVQAAYRSVRECPVPTIAVIEGSCWGCGLEFVLNCRHRIAADTGDTQFRMTEIADYHDLPVFGSTHNLPLQLGLPRAIDLLIWGTWWSAADALAGELVQRLAPAREVEPAVQAFILDVVAGRTRAATARRRPFQAEWEHLLTQTRARIDELPPRYQSPRRRALELRETASRTGTANEAVQELLHLCETTRDAKDAYSFFHIRQSAARQAAPPGYPLPGRVSLEFRGPAVARLREELAARGDLTGTRIEFGEAAERWCRLVAATDPAARNAVGVVEPALLARPPAEGDLLARPGSWPASRLIELREPEPGALRLLSAYLQRLGYSVAISRGPALGTGLLIGRYTAPLAAALLSGIQREAIEHTLRTFGFSRRPAQVLAALPPPAVAALTRPYLPAGVSDSDMENALKLLASPARWREGGGRAILVEALVVSLLAAVLDNLDGGGFPHPAIVDVAAQELLDFPLHLRSLCRFLTRERVAKALENENELSALVPGNDLQRARAFVANARRFYL